MAFALVGTIGSVVVSASGGSSSPLWGASENRTAGNLLILWISSGRSATIPGAPGGWTFADYIAGTLCTAGVYYRIATGADTAPVVAGVTSAVIAAQLAEFSGGATVQFDVAGGATGKVSPITATFGTADAAIGELWVACGADVRGAAKASVDTWTSNNCTPTLAGNNNGVSNVNHYSMAYGNTTANAAADTAVMTLSITASITGLAVVAATFFLPPPPYTSPYPQILPQ